MMFLNEFTHLVCIGNDFDFVWCCLFAVRIVELLLLLRDVVHVHSS